MIREPALEFNVRALPRPGGSKSGFLNKHTGRVMVVEKVNNQEWRQAVRQAALIAIRCCPDPTCTRLLDGFPLDEALLVDMVFTMPKPASAPKTRRTWPATRPDVVKLARTTEDSLTDVGVWRDDARVVEYGRLAKVYPREDGDALDAPGAVVRVWRLADVVWERDQPPTPDPATLFDPINL